MNDLDIEVISLLKELISDGQAPPHITNRAKKIIEKLNKLNKD